MTTDDTTDRVLRFADAHPDTEVGKLARELIEEHNQAEWAKQNASRPRRRVRRHKRKPR